MRDDRARLLDILEAIEKIERYSGVDKARFDHDELVQTWMVYYIQTIGEAAANLSDEFRHQHSDVPWRAIMSMRNALVHAYFRVDLDEVWNTVRKDIPVLRTRVQSLLEASKDGE